MRTLEKHLEAGLEAFIHTWKVGTRPDLEKDIYRLVTLPCTRFFTRIKDDF